MKRRMIPMLLTAAMIASSLSVPAFAASYADVNGHWAQKAIERWSDHGIVKGSDGQFRPDALLKRAELATIVANLLQLEKLPASNPFSDLDQNWYTDAILKCYAAGIMKGDGTTVRPNDPITREEAMVILSKALQIAPKTGDVTGFNDAHKVSSWAEGAVKALLEAGIVNGVGDDMLAPQGLINRASVVTILNNAIGHYVNEDGTKIDANGGVVFVVGDDVTVTGEADRVLVLGSGSEVTLEDVKVTGDVLVDGEGAKVVLSGNTEAANVVLTEDAKGASLAVGENADAGVVSVNAADAAVDVDGAADAIMVSEKATEVTVTVAAGADVAKDDIVTEADCTEIIFEEKGTSSGGSSGSGGGGSSRPSHTHAYSEWESNEDGTHSKECANSGCNAQTVTEECYYSADSMLECEACGYRDGNYHVTTAEQLQEIAVWVNNGNEDFSGKTVLLENNIDLKGIEWTPIGTNADSANKFKGTFDGQNHTISNLTVDTTAEPAYQATGFFGALNGTAKNLVFKNANINGLSAGDPTDNGIAVVAGSIYTKGSIDNVDVIGATVTGNRYVAGIAGYVYGNITNCTVKDITLTATPDDLDGNGVYDNGDKVGVIAGYFASEGVYKVSDNSVTDAVINAYRDAGGIIGSGNQVATVTNNDVTNVTINIDQTSDAKYGAKDPNAGAIVGRITAGTLDDSNESSNVSINYKLQGVTEDAVAMVGSTTYPSLEKAVEAVSANGKIILLKDVKLTADITTNKSFTIDGSGKNFDAYTFTVKTESDAVITYNNVYFTNDIAVEGSHTFDGSCGYADNMGVALFDTNGTVDTVTFTDKNNAPWYWGPSSSPYMDTLIVGDEYYVFNGEKLEALIEELNEATIVLYAVKITNEEILVGSDKDITLRGESSSYVFDGQLEVRGKLTVKNLTVTNENAATSETSKKTKNAFFVQGEGVLTCEKVTFNIAKATGITSWWSTGELTNVTVKDCVFNCNGNRPLQLDGNGTIEGCTFNNPYRYAVQTTCDGATLTVKNNTINKTEDNKNPVYLVQLTRDYGNANMVIEGSGNKINRTAANTGAAADYLYVWEAGIVTMDDGNETFVDIATITHKATDGDLICIDEDGKVLNLVEANGAYYVQNLEGLKELAKRVNEGESFSGKTVKLVADIDLNNEEWTPIGKNGAPFSGTFDGQNHIISNLVITGNNSDVGLFGFTQNGEVKNLNVDNAKVSGYLDVGAIAGTPYTSKYTNIKLTGLVEINGFSYVGGMFGKNVYANTTDLTIDADAGSYVNANSVSEEGAYRTYVGGVAGFMGEGSHTMKNVTSNIDVIGSTCDVGGIVGIAHYNNNFVNCSSSGDVTITGATDDSDIREIGGIAGVWHNESGTKVTLTDCEYTGKLSCTRTNGEAYTAFDYNGLVGKAYNTTGTGQLIIDGNTYNVQGYFIDEDGNWEVFSADGLEVLNQMMKDKTAGKNVVVNITDDIDFTGKTWTPVDSHADTAFYISEINGNGNTISNLTINGQAMFTRFAGTGDVTIKDITFDNATVNSGAINTSILTVQSYQNVLLDNVDVKNSTITGGYKVAPLIATVYNESSSTVTATLVDCDVTNCTVKATSYDFCTAGMVAFVYADDNDKIEFEDCTVTDVKLIAPNDSYKAHAAIYTTGSGSLFNEAEGVTVTNVTFEAL